MSNAKHLLKQAGFLSNPLQYLQDKAQYHAGRQTAKAVGRAIPVALGIGSDMKGVRNPGGVAPSAPTPSPAAPDWNKEFKKYHDTSFNPNSTMDRGKLDKMKRIYKEHGKLSPSLVYAKSAALASKQLFETALGIKR